MAQQEQVLDRASAIMRVSKYGIAVNLLLVAVKAAVGIAAHSVSVLLDAVNNLSDALSSVITMIGTKLAGRAADRKHPYGHGRIEYITALLIAVIVLLAGVKAFRESVSKILQPAETNYTAVSLALLAAGVIAKIFLGRYFRRQGDALNSTSLTASGTDALMDAAISFATLIAAILAMTLGWKLEGILGAVISVFILKAGAEIMLDTMHSLIGSRADPELTDRIKAALCSYPEVQGAYDLILHSYGPEKYFGSVHVELDDRMTVREMDALTRRIVPQIYSEFGVLLTVGVYAANDSDAQAKAIRDAVCEELRAYPQMLQMHGFYADLSAKAVSFDVIFDFRTGDPHGDADALRRSLTQRFPDYQFYINIDRDFSESDA